MTNDLPNTEPIAVSPQPGAENSAPQASAEPLADPTLTSMTKSEAHPDADTTVKYSTKVRLGTITWGLILLAVGAGLIILASGYRFDIELALIGVLAFAGLTLVGGSLVKVLRK